MNGNRPSPIRFVSGKVPFGLLAIVLFAVSRPTPVAAQCVLCGLDFQEGTIECIDYIVGADGCMMGTDWCFTFGDPCEWIMHLDFAEDGSAYVLREPSVRTDGESVAGSRTAVAESRTVPVSRTCDGVLLGLAANAKDDAFSSEAIILEL